MSDGAVLSFFTPRPDSEPLVLHGEHAVTVTKEERHQAALARHLSSDGRARQMAVELGFCRVAEGKYRGNRAIEVRIGAERVGELTARMSERYAPLVEAVLAAGRRPVCEAVVTGGSRGAQVELRLPAPDTLPTSPPSTSANLVYSVNNDSVDRLERTVAADTAYHRSTHGRPDLGTASTPAVSRDLAAWRSRTRHGHRVILVRCVDFR